MEGASAFLLASQSSTTEWECLCLLWSSGHVHLASSAAAVWGVVGLGAGCGPVASAAVAAGHRAQLQGLRDLAHATGVAGMGMWPL